MSTERLPALRRSGYEPKITLLSTSFAVMRGRPASASHLEQEDEALLKYRYLLA